MSETERALQQARETLEEIRERTTATNWSLETPETIVGVVGELTDVILDLVDVILADRARKR